MTTYNLFPGAVPLIQAYDKGTPVSVGTSFKVTGPTWLTHMRYVSGHGNNGLDVDYSIRQGTLWEVSNAGDLFTKVAGPFAIPAPSGPDVWTEVALAVPIALETGKLYRIAIFHPNGGYPALTQYFSPAGDTHIYGPVIAPSSDQVPFNAQGSFKYSPYVSDPPDTGFNHASYFSDVTITDVDPTAVNNVFAADGTAYRASILVNDILTTTAPTL